MSPRPDFALFPFPTLTVGSGFWGLDTEEMDALADGEFVPISPPHEEEYDALDR